MSKNEQTQRSSYAYGMSKNEQTQRPLYAYGMSKTEHTQSERRHRGKHFVQTLCANKESTQKMVHVDAHLDDARHGS